MTVRARRAALGLGVLAVAVAAPVPSGVWGGDCQRWAGRDVAEVVSYDQVIDAARQVRTVAVPVLPGGGAVAVGPVVVTDRPEDVFLAVHEATHTAQWSKEGPVRFVGVYAADLGAGRFHGCGWGDAYRAVRYEREAHGVVDAFAVAFGDAAAEDVVAQVRGAVRGVAAGISVPNR